MHLLKGLRLPLAAGVTAAALVLASVGVSYALPMVKVCYFNPGHHHICQWVPRP